MNKQAEALRLADELSRAWQPTAQQAAAELRRLHNLTQELIESLEFCAGSSYVDYIHEVAEEALIKAKKEPQ